MKNRIPFTKLQKILVLLGTVVLAYTFLQLTMLWPDIPTKIATHFNAAGEADSFGSKGSLWFTPIIGTILCVGVFIVSLFPSIWNMPVEITPQNQDILYKKTRNMLCGMNLILAINFSYLTLQQAKGKSLGSWFLPIMLLLLFGTIAYEIVSIIYISRKIKHDKK
ncbi:DUF1648 domain-containing protein [Paludicola sp. MB14-C6]|uniref:DUF1648 domain-containing protein n=1 Tax=Paludihabitans sp. MB14-C6 TaxID=3070656 RepID=UPI0027DE2918|nr:DUF1648 domain-containing protein [Paludicola sp. MB14-C6]WMJ24394.1 DUF1648 domain-containing protein [Paludicola sp. MB14-C6]